MLTATPLNTFVTSNLLGELANFNAVPSATLPTELWEYDDIEHHDYLDTQEAIQEEDRIASMPWWAYCWEYEGGRPSRTPRFMW